MHQRVSTVCSCLEVGRATLILWDLKMMLYIRSAVAQVKAAATAIEERV